jgi:type IV pilus assembly protein PilF
MKRSWVAVLALSILAGCAANPSVPDVGVTEPVSKQPALTATAKRAKAHAELGMQYLFLGKPTVALDEARQAIGADSSYPLGYNLLALVQMTLKDNSGADENFKRALHLAPGDPEISNNYGWFLCQTGHEKQSIPYFLTAANAPLYSTPTKAFTNAGMCSMSIKDNKAAEEYLTKALRADSTNLDALFLLADVYYREGRLREAKARLDDVHRRREPSAQSDWLGLRIARKLGDNGAENRYAEDLRHNFSDSREYQLLEQGKFE